MSCDFGDHPREKILDKTTQYESLLRDRFGADGRGLHEKISSVEPELGHDIVSALRFIATVRNKAVHDRCDFGELMPRFKSACQRVDTYFDDTDIGAVDDDFAGYYRSVSYHMPDARPAYAFGAAEEEQSGIVDPARKVTRKQMLLRCGVVAVLLLAVVGLVWVYHEAIIDFFMAIVSFLFETIMEIVRAILKVLFVLSVVIFVVQELWKRL